MRFFQLPLAVVPAHFLQEEQPDLAQESKKQSEARWSSWVGVAHETFTFDQKKKGERYFRVHKIYRSNSGSFSLFGLLLEPENPVFNPLASRL